MLRSAGGNRPDSTGLLRCDAAGCAPLAAGFVRMSVDTPSGRLIMGWTSRGARSPAPRIGFRRARLLAVTCLVCGVLALGAARAFANVALRQLSSDPYTNATSYHATEVEPDTYASGSTLVSAFQSGRFFDGGASNVGWATTSNGGSSTSNGFLPGTTPFSSPAGPYARVSDPSVAHDTKHGVWLISSLALIQASGGPTGAAVIVNRSTNGGSIWSSPVNVAAASAGQNFDKEWIVCDENGSSPHYGNCYAEWDDNGNGNQLEMAVSSDGGQTWKQSTVPSAGVIGGQPLVQPNGNVIVPIDNAVQTAVESFVSTDGGASYSGPNAISGIANHTEAGSLRSGPLPTAELDGAGKVYVAWSDCRFISGCSANDIVFSSSSDGVNWSAVARVPIDPTSSGVDHFLPGLAVDRSTSGASARLALAYYDYPSTNCSTASCRLDVGFVSSADGGSSWTAPTQLAGPSTLNELANTDQGFMVGDYISTSFASAQGGDAALPVFAVGNPVTGQTCSLGQVTSCNEPVDTPSTPLTAAAAPAAGRGAAPTILRSAATGPVLSAHSDHPAATSPLRRR
jgi:hypothetical protein